MERDSILTDVRYAMMQLVGVNAAVTRAACVDRASRALDALERVEAALDDPGNAQASDDYLAGPLEVQIGEQASLWTTDDILRQEG